MAKYDLEELKGLLTEAINNADESLTANALAKQLGYAKATARIKDALYSLGEAGTIMITTTDAGYEAWDSTVADSSDAGDGIVAPENLTDVDVKEFKLPDADYGYQIAESDDGYSVAFPDGKDIELGAGERLLVINKNASYRFIVEDPEDVLAAIGTFTEEAGYAHFLVKEMASGKHIKSPNDLGDDVVLFLEITRHNKAGSLEKLIELVYKLRRV